MTNIHLHIFVENLIGGLLGHTLHNLQLLGQVLRQAEGEATLGNGLCTYLTRKVIESAEKITVYLLQSFHSTFGDCVKQIAIE